MATALSAAETGASVTSSWRREWGLHKAQQSARSELNQQQVERYVVVLPSELASPSERGDVCVRGASTNSSVISDRSAVVFICAILSDRRSRIRSSTSSRFSRRKADIAFNCARDLPNSARMNTKERMCFCHVSKSYRSARTRRSLGRFDMSAEDCGCLFLS